MSRRGLNRHGLIRDFDAGSGVVRAFVALTEDLMQHLADESKPVVAVTSAARGDGRSTIAGNLTACLARLKHRKTLLIDGDLRRPVQAKRWGLKQSAGLSGVLLGKVKLEEAIQSIEDQSGLLAAGGDANAFLIPSHEEMWRSMMEECHRRFDWIIVDCPPLYAGAAVTIGRSATGAVLVARANVTRGEVLQSCGERLEELCVRNLGVVLNQRRYDIPNFAYRRL
jgi:capsular exopolysaccharide synthesis family protein